MPQLTNRRMAKVLLSQDKNRETSELVVSKEEIGIAGWGKSSVTENMRSVRMMVIREEIDREMEEILTRRGLLNQTRGAVPEQRVLREVEALFSFYYERGTISDFNIQVDNEGLGEGAICTIRFVVGDSRFNQQMGYRFMF